ncbi:bifunctional folylpolyglutamate synthase/dihydrofolate synthase [Streptococcus loxodontisalivarius]|uniref:Dihydrofolate synthase/folylpolyglutamate synthase n=1 Tax=Streptococcus loxodontisalivarius TaxID=1349415 RepID=A0ABS2PSA8_9STRE|nr:folylpolyglutamate synthase/dihydrofolate synthase family protein [Streptococcus loxodontisalivarius]MBM7642435.1 dihydrofolate synthase/folylpolyglutamate synthase [Streptococcus loxodontisalivarius]
MNYQETLNYIHSFKAKGRPTNLERMRWVLDKIGNPQNTFPAVHIVGTNGKGSTTAYLREIFKQAGYKTGSFTSPFIRRFNERIAINSEEISDQKLIELVDSLRPIIDTVDQETDFGPVTEFELVTLLMFQHFANEKVDIAMIEAGIGGKTDATNVFTAKAMVCTSIGFDHTDKLGTSLADIAGHKLGALDKQVPIIFPQLTPELRQLFTKTAQEQESETYALGTDFSVLENGRAFEFGYRDQKISDIRLKMLGQHQVANAALASMTSLVLTKDFPQISLANIKVGLETTSWPGRSEWLADNLILDGAHNPQGLESLKAMLDQYFPDRTVHILFAGLKRKPVGDMLAILKDYDITVTSFDFFEAMPLEDYDDHFAKITDFRHWIQKSQGSEDLYVITGSLYFISQVREYLLENQN